MKRWLKACVAVVATLVVAVVVLVVQAWWAGLFGVEPPWTTQLKLAAPASGTVGDDAVERVLVDRGAFATRVSPS